jgi:Domain of unknown function (DUF4129)
MDRHALRRWWPLAAVLVLLALATLATARSSPQFGEITSGVTDPGAAPTPQPEEAKPSLEPSQVPDVPDRQAVQVPGWLDVLGRALCGLFLAALVAALAWYALRDRPRRRLADDDEDDDEEDPARTADDVVAALDAVLVELSDADRDPRRAVIACWVRLEQAAAAAGTPRHPGDTPTDLVSRLLRAHRVSADVLATFADVYREARYATHTVDEAMRTQARSALRRLRAELAAGAAAPQASAAGSES